MVYYGPGGGGGGGGEEGKNIFVLKDLMYLRTGTLVW